MISRYRTVLVVHVVIPPDDIAEAVATALKYKDVMQIIAIIRRAGTGRRWS